MPAAFSQTSTRTHRDRISDKENSRDKEAAEKNAQATAKKKNGLHQRHREIFTSGYSLGARRVDRALLRQVAVGGRFGDFNGWRAGGFAGANDALFFEHCALDVGGNGWVGL